MVKTITIDNDVRFEQSSFIIVRKSSNFYVKNDKYDFQNHNQLLIGRFYLKSIENIQLNNITDLIAYLDKNVDANIYKEIQKTVYNSKDTELLSVLLFSNRVSEHEIHQKLQKPFYGHSST